jgi:ubiquinone/menaquinone biosynthesis C-methylase UbiE
MSENINQENKVQKFEAQVDRAHYDFDKYLDLKRFSSYWYQLSEILKLKPESIIEIGPGDYVFANYIKQNTDIKYTSVDFAEDLSPDVVADIRKLPFADDSVDLVCAFEVLEHLPFDELESTMRELLRVSAKNVLISMPHWGRSFAFTIQIPFIGIRKLNFKLPYKLFAIEHVWNGEHYFEIGKKGYPENLVREKIKNAGGKLIKDFVPTENTYHHFFIIQK